MPFRGDTAGVLTEAILNRAPVTPARLNPNVPLELEHIISKALEKDRKLRYQSAAELRTDLQRLKRDTDSVDSVAATAEPALAGAKVRGEAAQMQPETKQAKPSSYRSLAPIGGPILIIALAPHRKWLVAFLPQGARADRQRHNCAGRIRKYHRRSGIQWHAAARTFSATRSISISEPHI